MSCYIIVPPLQKTYLCTSFYKPCVYIFKLHVHFSLFLLKSCLQIQSKYYIILSTLWQLSALLGSFQRQNIKKSDKSYGKENNPLTVLTQYLETGFSAQDFLGQLSEVVIVESKVKRENVIRQTKPGLSNHIAVILIL